MKLKTFKDLYIQQLKDLYSAEKQIIRALPKMAKAALNQELAEAFNEHLIQSKEQAERLEEILSSHDATTRGTTCKAMEGLLEEGTEVIEADMDDQLRDAALIAVAQRVEHYEISAYGTVRTFAELIGDKRGAKLLQTTLDEEAETDRLLTELAEESVNETAINA